MNPDQISVLHQQAVSLAESHRQGGRLAMAEELCRGVLNANPNHVDALHVLGIVASQLGKFERAAEELGRAASLSPANSVLHHNLGNVLWNLSRHDEAERAFRRALHLKPDYYEAHNNLGNALKARGKLQEAEGCYRRALGIAPQNAEAHNNLGTVQQELGQIEEAARSYSQALALAPAYADAHNNLGTVLQHSARYEEAERAYRCALVLKPDYALAHNNLGTVLRDLGRLPEAEKSYREALRLKPDFPEAYNNLGTALKSLNSFQEAESSYLKAIALRPDYAEAHNNLGSLLHQLRRVSEAERSVRAALAISPQFAFAHHNLGVTLAEQGRLEEAERSFRYALAINPAIAETHYYLGNVLKDLGRNDESMRAYVEVLNRDAVHLGAILNLGVALHRVGRTGEAAQGYRRALALRPDLADVHNNLGTLQRHYGQIEDAERSFVRALALKPSEAKAHYNLALLRNDAGRLEEAEASCRKALELDSQFIEARSQWYRLRQYLCAWGDLPQEGDLLRKAVVSDKPAAILPFVFLTLPNTCAHEHRACARKFAENKLEDLLVSPAVTASASRPDRNKCRIGYLSSDYCQHPTAALLTEVIERHDRTRFEVFGYSYGKDDGTTAAKRIRAAFDTLRELREVDEQAAAQLIAEDGVDILVDLKGYTSDARLAITALRPAPVLVNWLGYPGTFGHPRLADYLIGDPIVTPLEHAGFYSESLALMPHCYQPNDRQRTVGKRPTRKRAGLPRSGFVFCSLNQCYKITPEIFDLWCRLLVAVPRSMLWLLESNPTAQANLMREAAARGIGADRLVFAPKLPMAEHLARLQLADLALDTYPCTSHTTASDALWVGVPLVTLLGNSFISRVAASIVSAAGLGDLVAENPKDYYRLALELAAKPARLKKIKAKLAKNRLTCPLFDSERFTRDLELLYERMWQAHRAGTSGHLVARSATGM